MRTLSIALLAAIAILSSCQRQQAPVTSGVVMVQSEIAPASPSDVLWKNAPEFRTKLLLQDIVEPRLLQPSTKEVSVRALLHGQDLSIRLEWRDSTLNDAATPSRFSDACAIQLPNGESLDLPAPQMGETGRTVEITYWNASWQAVVDGRIDSITALYPNAAIDHYPFEAPSLVRESEAHKQMSARYAPARALGNNMAGPRATPVQDLVAQGAGTITSSPSTTSTGSGRRTKDGWSVVITRRLTSSDPANLRSHIAFAVWDGAGEEVGARKMRTDWIPLILRGTR